MYTVGVMPNYYAQVTLASSTGETADNQNNTLSFATVDPLDSTGADDMTALIKAFYDTCKTIGAMAGLAQAGHTIKFYVADLVTPNYPVFATAFNMATAAVVVSLPKEVSLCVSFMNDSFTAVPRARRRGRIYISGWLSAENTNGRPNISVPGELADAFQTYAEGVNAIDGFSACVWSRITGDLYPLERCWVDNEWDTMRSRGGKSTTRSELIILP